MRQKFLSNQSLSPRIIVYTPTGNGRDSYILSNNGGFYKEYVMPKIRDKFQQANNAKHYDLSLRDRPINRYYANGNGRDLYVVRENPSNRDSRLAQLDLPTILRNEKYSSQPLLKKKEVYPLKSEHLKQLSHQYHMQKKVLDRLFYGKGEASERSLSPRVQFAKKKQINKGRNNGSSYASSSVHLINTTSQSSLKANFSFSSSSSSLLKKQLENIFKNRTNRNQA